MSKKRNKNKRKKEAKARSKDRRPAPPPTVPGAPSESPPPQWGSDYSNADAEAPSTTPGGIGKFRSFMSHKEDGPDASLLHKRRSCAELLVWLAGAMAIAYLVLRQLGAF